MRVDPERLPVSKAHELEVESPRRRWLIESLWTRQAVGLLGGPPKSCKSWLGLERDRQRLDATLSHLRPRLLLLDPLVRLHQLDENSAADVARLLGFLRCLQRRHQTAILLVHHAGKKQRLSAGQNLRGSSDLHAFGDSNLYLARRRQGLVLTIEHRAAPAPEPFPVELVPGSDGWDTHLEIRSPLFGSDSQPLTERAWRVLQNSEKPLTRTALRTLLRVNNQRLGSALDRLQLQGRILRTPRGWLPSATPPKNS